MEESLDKQWRSRIESSPEVRNARQNIEFHRKKMRSLHEELNSAEIWEVELLDRLKKIEERVQPPLMKLYKLLNTKEGSVSHSDIEECVSVSSLDEIQSVLNRKILKCEELDREELLKLVKVVVTTRDVFAERDCQEGILCMQKLAGTTLKHLGRSTIEWEGMSKWETETVRSLIKEVVGVPPFLANIADQLLLKLHRDE